jgi:Rps23 Pro-64 3,4-dihydroxylase Tpa1-like proline 4-hydroxylase
MIKYSVPFDHIILDDFLELQKARELSNEFLDFDDHRWFYYNNPLENKKACNDYHLFPSETYRFFKYLNGPEFVEYLCNITGIKKLYPDYGLHGAGWHMHGRGGKLNVHLDYNIHPKLKLQRKLNLIYYLTEDWQTEWGGGLELWSHNEDTNQPKKLVKTIDNIFNRAVVFDTTQHSWHGFATPLNCPENIYRKSIAMYYLIDPPSDAVQRMRALYSPSSEQTDNPEIKKLIEERVK